MNDVIDNKADPGRWLEGDRAADPGRSYFAWSPICAAGFTALHQWIETIREMSAMAAGSVRDNKGQHRFEMDVDGAVAFANYRLTPSAVIITHTETPRNLRGRGVASELVRGALDLIRGDGLKVIGACGFVVDYLNKHPEYADLVG